MGVHVPRLARPLLASALASSFAGCLGLPFDPPLAPLPQVEGARSIDVAPLADEGDILGVTIDGDRFDVLVDGVGLVQLDRLGREQARYAVGAGGLWEMPYRDVAAEGDGRFILLADGEGYFYDAVTEQQRVHFCVEPDMEPEPGTPTLTQKNDAVALQDNVIVAAPRFYDDATGALVESSLRTYRATDGMPTGSADLTAMGVELDGVALHDGDVWGVSSTSLHRFTTAGARRSETNLKDVQRATGVAIDAAAREVWVLDADGARLVAFALDDL